MKRLLFALVAAIVGSMVLSPSLFAGMNYIQYQENFRESQNVQAVPQTTTSTPLMHQSPYNRTQESPAGTTVSSPSGDQQRFINKYDRTYWDPNQ